jgi:hypothetical protein
LPTGFASSGPFEVGPSKIQHASANDSGVPALQAGAGTGNGKRGVSAGAERKELSGTKLEVELTKLGILLRKR